MGTKLEQDCADALQSMQDLAKRRTEIQAAERARWQRHLESSKPCTGVWSPTMTAESRAALDKQIADGTLPF